MIAPGPAPRPLVFIGAGGHARVLHALAVAAGRVIAGVYDPRLAQQGVPSWRGVPVLGSDVNVQATPPGSVEFVNGVGQVIGADARRRIHERFRSLGFRFAVLIHPAAWVSDDAQLADGVQIMAGAIVQPGCSIGESTIVNTRAGVDHDCQIGSYVHIAPGATLCGTVEVEPGAYVGAGATVLQNRRIGSGAIVAAGATAARDLPPDHILMPGASARPLSQTPHQRSAR